MFLWNNFDQTWDWTLGIDLFLMSGANVRRIEAALRARERLTSCVTAGATVVFVGKQTGRE